MLPASTITRDANDAMSGVVSNIIGMVGRHEAPRRGSRELLLSFSRLPHVRSVVGRISTAVASVPAYVMEEVNGEWVTAPPMHPMQMLWDRPNDKMSHDAFLELISNYYDLCGEAFAVVEDDERGEPGKLWPIPPTWVTMIPEMNGDVYHVRMPGMAGLVVVPASHMVYVRVHDPANPYGRGTGIMGALGDELDTDEFAAKHLKAWFLNRCTPSYLFGVEVDDEYVKEAKEQFDEKNKGVGANNKIHWTNGKITAVRLDDTFKDMDIVALRNYQAKIVRETLNVPPEVIGQSENSNRATSENAVAIFSDLVVKPRISAIYAAFNKVLSPRYSYKRRTVLKPNDPTPDSKTFQLEVMKAFKQAFTVNDARELANKPPMDDGDERMSEGAAPTFPQLPPPSDAKSFTTRAFVTKQPTKKDIKAALAQDPSERVIVPGVKRTIHRMGESSLKELGLPNATPFDWRSVTANYLRNETTSKIKEIDEHTAELIQTQLAEGYAAGESIAELKDRIRGSFGFGPGATASEARSISARARTVARTETLGAANYGRLEAWKQQAPGLVTGKTWLSVSDDGRNREDHLAYTGTTVPLDADFEIDGVKMDAPCNSGDPGQDINCRCTTLPDMGDGTKMVVGTNTKEMIETHKAFNRDAKYYEMQMLIDVNSNFKRQMENVFKTLE